jgi:hypothetical protein
MSAKKKTPSQTLTAEAAEAQSVLRMNEWITQVDAAERMSVGSWLNIPPQYTGWVFMRCGLRGVDRAEALAASLRRMGYMDAPRGTQCAGFDSDGERGLYLMIPRKGYAMLQERKRGIRRSVQTATNAFETAVGSINKMGAGLNAEVRTSRQEIKAEVG